MKKYSISSAIDSLLDNFIILQKDIVSVYSTMPKEQVVPLIVTTIGVSLIKIIAIAGVIILIKWIIAKLRNKDTNN